MSCKVPTELPWRKFRTIRALIRSTQHPTLVFREGLARISWSKEAALSSSPFPKHVRAERNVCSMSASWERRAARWTMRQKWNQKVEVLPVRLSLAGPTFRGPILWRQLPRSRHSREPHSSLCWVLWKEAGREHGSICRRNCRRK